MSRITMLMSKLRRGPSAQQKTPSPKMGTRDPWVRDTRDRLAKLERDVFWLVQTLWFVTGCLSIALIVVAVR